MPTRRRQLFINAQVAWMLSAVLGLSIFEVFTFELFFIVSLIGFLVVVEITDSVAVTPRWRDRLKWLIALGLVGFVVVIVRRVLTVLLYS